MNQKSTIIYNSINYAVLNMVPLCVKRVLDIGCGTGVLGREIKKRTECEVIGITNSHLEASIASTFLDEAIESDISLLMFENLGRFDCIICSHVLEHLLQPQELLYKLRDNLTPDGKLIVALPNTLYWRQRFEFLKGNFRYADYGTLDRTHLRFFDWNTAFKLIQDSGYRVTYRCADGSGLPLPLIRSLFPNLASRLDRQAPIKLFPGLFGFQFVLIGEIPAND